MPSRVHPVLWGDTSSQRECAVLGRNAGFPDRQPIQERHTLGSALRADGFHGGQRIASQWRSGGIAASSSRATADVGRFWDAVRMTDVPADDMVDAFAERLHPYMDRILGGGEDPHLVVGELKWALTEPPYFEQLWGVGWLYRIWGDLSDIVDGWPVDYGPGREAIADREVRQAAQDWLSTPHTAAGLEDYIERWKARLAALPPGERRTR